MSRKTTHLKIVSKENLYAPKNRAAIETINLNVWFNDSHVLKDIKTNFEQNSITGIIGPSGSGKSTLIRSLNRINDEMEGFRYTGEIRFNNINIYSKDLAVHDIRKQIGMIFQKPCIFPKSIFENVLFGIRHLTKLTKDLAHDIVEENLKAVSLWKEVSGRLHNKAITLSLGQQQRLCIARALAIKPEVILMDEPTSALDPVSTLAIEDLIKKLKKKYTIVFVTHNIEQAKRISDNIIFICEGKIIEQGSNEKIFSNPCQQQTKDYLERNICEC